MLPIVLGGIPFGLIAGVACANLGLTTFEAGASSLVMFAGAAQLATYDLLSRNAPFAVVLATALIINLRFAIYSAGIAPEFREEKRLHRLLYAYLLTDQSFALTNARRINDPNAPHQVAYYLGGAILLWGNWIAWTCIGAAAGATIPPSWSLDFAVPLCFVAILIPAIKDRAQVFAGVITGVASLLLLKAPHSTGGIISVLIGIGAGALFDRWSKA